MNDDELEAKQCECCDTDSKVLGLVSKVISIMAGLWLVLCFGSIFVWFFWKFHIWLWS